MLNLRKKIDGKLIFYICLIAIPLIQFCIFYIYVNINSVLLAFKNYEITGAYEWVGFDNFKDVFNELKTNSILQNALKNTGLVLILTLCIGSTLPVLVSYYIYKKKPLWGTFRVLLFLPSIVSSLALVLSYKYFIEVGIPEIWQKSFDVQIKGLLTNQDTNFLMIFIYTFIFGMGSGFLLYTGAMSGISDSVVDSAKVDGFSSFQEFIYITVPMIYPTFVTFLVVNMGTIFANQINLYSFHDTQAPEKQWTIGYYIYVKTQLSDFTGYPYLSAFGLLCTVIIVPITLLSKYLLERFGPSVE